MHAHRTQVDGPGSHDRVYVNEGNPPLLALVEAGAGRILDIGCGAGNNAALLKSRDENCEVYGVTVSEGEASLASQHLEHCWVFDAEGEIPTDLTRQSFDVLIFSHVLEHFRDPSSAVAKFSRLLRSGGQVVIAVPNVLSWRMRVQFLLGRFEYASAGVLDDTHLRFFTYLTADKYLLSEAPDLELTHKVADGSAPLWVLRRYFLPSRVSGRIDRFVSRCWPNLFGGQVLIRAVKR